METRRIPKEHIDDALIVRLRNQTNDNLFVRIYEPENIHYDQSET